jgi:hypothetical protein
MRTLHRPIALVLFVGILSACSTYRTTTLTPQEAIAGHRTVKVRLAGTESTEITITGPWIHADSIGGATSTNPHWSAPLSSVVEVKTKRVDPVLTASIVAAALLVFRLAWGNGAGGAL